MAPKEGGAHAPCPLACINNDVTLFKHLHQPSFAPTPHFCPSPDPFGLQDSVLPGAQATGAPSEHLVAKLLESLDRLKTTRPHSSRGTSPSPLDGSVSASYSSPRNVLNQGSSSASSAISRATSAESLIAAVQQLGLGVGGGQAISPTPFLPVAHTACMQGHALWAPLPLPPTVTAPPLAPIAPVHQAFIGAALPAPTAILPPRPTATTPPLTTIPAMHQDFRLGAALPTPATALPPRPPLHLPPPVPAMEQWAEGVHALSADHLLHLCQVAPPRVTPHEECLVGLHGAYQPYCHQVRSRLCHSALPCLPPVL